MVLTKIYFLRIVLKRRKISLYLKASPIEKTRDAQNVCAITTEGTALKIKSEWFETVGFAFLLVLNV